MKVWASVGSGLEIFGLGLTVLPNVRARAYSGLPKCEKFGLGFGGSGLSGLSGFSFQFYCIFMWQFLQKNPILKQFFSKNFLIYYSSRILSVSHDKIWQKWPQNIAILAEILILLLFLVKFSGQIQCFGSRGLEFRARAYRALNFSRFFGLGPDGLHSESSGFRAWRVSTQH